MIKSYLHCFGSWRTSYSLVKYLFRVNGLPQQTPFRSKHLSSEWRFTQTANSTSHKVAIPFNGFTRTFTWFNNDIFNLVHSILFFHLLYFLLYIYIILYLHIGYVFQHCSFFQPTSCNAFWHALKKKDTIVILDILYIYSHCQKIKVAVWI